MSAQGESGLLSSDLPGMHHSRFASHLGSVDEGHARIAIAAHIYDGFPAFVELQKKLRRLSEGVGHFSSSSAPLLRDGNGRMWLRRRSRHLLNGTMSPRAWAEAAITRPPAKLQTEAEAQGEEEEDADSVPGDDIDDFDIRPEEMGGGGWSSGNLLDTLVSEHVEDREDVVDDDDDAEVTTPAAMHRGEGDAAIRSLDVLALAVLAGASGQKRKDRDDTGEEGGDEMGKV
jgi:hypothetical protein